MLIDFFVLEIIMSPRRRNKYNNYDNKSLEKALEAVATGRLSIRAAAEAYDVPKSTLSDKYHGKHISKNGRPNALSNTDENHLLHGILTAAKWGYPLTSLKTTLKNVLKIMNPAENGLSHLWSGTRMYYLRA